MEGSTRTSGTEARKDIGDERAAPVRPVEPREHVRGYYEPNSRFDDRFASDPPVREVGD